jgi:hypothetical protein
VHRQQACYATGKTTSRNVDRPPQVRPAEVQGICDDPDDERSKRAKRHSGEHEWQKRDRGLNVACHPYALPLGHRCYQCQRNELPPRWKLVATFPEEPSHEDAAGCQCRDPEQCRALFASEHPSDLACLA